MTLTHSFQKMKTDWVGLPLLLFFWALSLILKKKTFPLGFVLRQNLGQT